MLTTPALLFDLDGVLIDSEPVHARNWLDLFRETGIRFPEDQAGRFIGLRGEELLKWLREFDPQAAAGFDLQTMLDKKRQRFLESLDQIPVVAGADAFLRAQHGRRRLGLVTSSRLRTLGAVLAHFGWRELFEVVVGGDHVAQTKPHPEPYLQAAARLHLAPAECLVFEDSTPGVESARAAGMEVCAVASSFGEDKLRGAGARWVIRDFTDAATLDQALGAHP
jgi:HAD superfamily hydrolase (TIGR01509 family)